jgi:hypothetical protein
MAGHHRRHYPDKEKPEIETTGKRMKFTDIPNKVKAWCGAFIAVVAVAGTIFVWIGYLHTDAEAMVHVEDFENYQEQQLKSDKFDRIDRIQREIDRIDYQLLEVELPQHKRDYLTHKREDLVEKTKCIRADTC